MRDHVLQILKETGNTTLSQIQAFHVKHNHQAKVCEYSVQPVQMGHNFPYLYQ